MATVSTLALAGGAATLALYWVKRKIQDSKEPPSVGSYPLVGSHFHLEEPFYLSLYEKFGKEPIVRIFYGTHCVYILNRWAAFKEAMIDNADHVTGREQQDIVQKLIGENGGIAMSEGETWRSYRRFTLKTLRDFGFGRQGAEEIIAVEAEYMIGTIEAAGGKPMETTLLMSTATSNVICQLVFGSRVASEDPRFSKMLDTFRDITQNSGSNLSRSVLMTVMPILRFVPQLFSLFVRLPAAQTMVKNFNILHAFCSEQRERHAAEVDKLDQARDYIDAHLQHQQHQPEMFTDTRLTLAVMDLFVAGTDTTAHSIRWAILFLIKHPDVAEKMHNEIVGLIGRDRLPKAQDKASLNYTQAVIEEVHRKASLATLGLIHRLTQEITVCGTQLKANSLCGFNVYAIHHDPEVFPEPQRFLPERHLKDGQFVPSPYMATFGLGKRACLGESLARMELFIFLTVLVQRYRFSLDPEESRSLWDLMEDPSFTKGTIMRAPPVHKIVFTPWP